MFDLSLRQEFSFAHPKTLLQVNQAYNSDYTGSPVWDLFCKEEEMLENSYSVAVRLMFGLPRETHRYLIEPLTDRRHVKFDLISRFMNFTDKIRKSKKETLIYVYNKIHRDVRSITGKNLTKIKNLYDKDDIENLKEIDYGNLVFRSLPPGEEWRVSLIRELIDVKFDTSKIESFNAEEIDEMLTYVCTTGPS